MRHLLLILSVIFSGYYGITQCEDFNVDTLVYHPTCHGFSDGAIDLLITGAAAPVTAEITDSDGTLLNADGTGTIFILSGNQWYYIWVMDADGCFYEDSVFLIDPLPMEVDIEIVPPSSPDVCDGDIYINEVLNTCNDEGYTCIWLPDPGTEGCNLIDVCPDNYTLYINDACGCSSVTEDIFLPGSLTGIQEDELLEIELKYLSKGLAQLKEALAEKITIEWYTLTGQLQRIECTNSGENIVNIPITSGLYFYRVLDEVGHNIGGGRLMIP
ncbi:MAG: hypothetical protein ACPG21_06310 [Crocinitomicaceae bacterium]